MKGKRELIYQKFWESYDRAIGLDGFKLFATTFYNNLFKQSSHIEHVLKPVSEEKRQHMLEQSIFYTSQMFLVPKVPRQVLRVAKIHRDMNLKKDDMDIWFHILIETVNLLDENFDNELELIWVNVLNPGLLYISARLEVNEKSQDRFQKDA